MQPPPQLIDTLPGNLRKFILNEYERVKTDPRRSFLSLAEILEMQAPPQLPITYSHIGTLFLLDSHGIGGASLQNLFDLALFVENQRKLHPPHLLGSRVQGLGTLALWSAAVRMRKHVERWILLLVVEAAGRLHTFDGGAHRLGSDVLYVSRPALIPLFMVLRPYLPHDSSFQQVFDLHQHAAEELGLLAIEDETFDDYVPVEVVEMLGKSMISGILEMMEGVGFNEGLAQNFAGATKHREVEKDGEEDGTTKKAGSQKTGAAERGDNAKRSSAGVDGEMAGTPRDGFSDGGGGRTGSGSRNVVVVVGGGGGGGGGGVEEDEDRHLETNIKSDRRASEANSNALHPLAASLAVPNSSSGSNYVPASARKQKGLASQVSFCTVVSHQAGDTSAGSTDDEDLGVLLSDVSDNEEEEEEEEEDEDEDADEDEEEEDDDDDDGDGDGDGDGDAQDDITEDDSEVQVQV